jgi:hypothetical protein
MGKTWAGPVLGTLTFYNLVKLNLWIIVEFNVL